MSVSTFVWCLRSLFRAAAMALPLLVSARLVLAAPVGPYLNGAFPNTAPNQQFGLVDVFPRMTFSQPIQLVPIPGHNKLAIVVKAGRIDVVDRNENATTVSIMLDVRSRTNDFEDGGLLGIAFHPNFGQPGMVGERWLFAYYRYTPDLNYPDRQLAFNRLSRFDVDPQTLVVSTEQVLFQQFDTHTWHNGGCLRFGTDGFLYVSVGDMGEPSVSQGTSQQIDSYLMSGVLRIDVNQDLTKSHAIRRQPQSPAGKPAGWPASFSQGYTIPNDNPWLSTAGAYLEEFWAIGLRSPHRMAFDPVTNDLWFGDTGYTSFEEVNFIRKGENAQWAYREGFQEQAAKPVPYIGIERWPVHAYPSGAVVGGYVYRGQRWAAELGGKYLFTDFNSSRLMALEHDEVTDTWAPEQVLSFAENGISLQMVSVEDIGDGNIYVLGFGQNGKVFRLEPLPPATGDAPAALSAVGAFTNLQTLQPAAGLIPYNVNTPLWSDRAVKQRWIALPNDGAYDTQAEQITFAEQGAWRFPAGTVFVKHFELPVNENNATQLVRLETRFLVVTDTGTAYGLTYRWNPEGTDAFLLRGSETRTLSVTGANGTVRDQIWSFPSPGQCSECHSAGAGYTLGLQTWQLNRGYTDVLGATNQLMDWRGQGLFSNPFTTAAFPGLAKGVSIGDATATEEARVDSYIAANCAHCHFPGGAASAFDARFQTPLDDVVLLPTQGHASTEAFLVQPGDRWQSELFIRDAALGAGAMPPLAKAVIDDEYVALLSSWIDGLGTGQTCTSAWIDRTTLTAIGASSEDLPNHRAADVLDGSIYSVWHTAWRNGYEPLPHDITIDLGGLVTLDAVSYLPRQDTSVSGTVVEYAVYLSETAGVWGAPVIAGSLPGTKLEQVIQFAPTAARYAKFEALSGVNAEPVTVVAELGFRAQTCIPEEPPDGSESTSSGSVPPGSSTSSGGSTSAPGEVCVSDWSATDEWAVVYADSEDIPTHVAEQAFDGSQYSVWHTAWRNGVLPPLPHELIIDLGEVQQLDAFRYLPRQDPSVSGMVQNFAFYVSEDGSFEEAPVANGTFGTGKAESVVVFPRASGRFIRFVALSELGTQGQTVVAELGVRTVECTPTGTGATSSSSSTATSSGPPPECDIHALPRTGFVVQRVDSEATGIHPGAHALDGSQFTVWHTEWRAAGGPAPLPHEIVIDMGVTQSVGGLRYLPRQDTSPSGSIGSYQIYVSDSPTVWPAAAAVGTFTNSKLEQTVTFPTSYGRYLRLVALSDLSGDRVTVAAELNILSRSCN